MKLKSLFQTPPKGISIRTILVLFYILLIGLVSIILIAVNQYLLNHVLINYTVHTIKQTNTYLESQIEKYFYPIAENVLDTARYIEEGVIEPGPSYKFKIYLHEVANDEPQIFAAFWATPQGDFYSVKREGRRRFEVWHIERSSTPPVYYYAKINPANQIQDVRKKLEEHYDPRIRPWYKTAIEKNRLIWVDVYQSTLLMKDGYFPELLATAMPVYKDGKLLGVFSVVITLDELTDFIQKIKISEHTIIMILDHNNSLLAITGGYNSDRFIGYPVTAEMLAAMHIKYPLKNILPTQEPSQQIRRYTDQGRYFVTQQIIKATNNAWKVIIIVPEADILGPLKTIALISALIMLAVLLLGIGIANYISKKIAAPIQELVKETEAIKNFELDKPTIIHSKIAELQTVSAAIDAMKKSLQSFKRYVPTLLVKKLFTSGHVAEVGGALTHITLLFADIKDFTHITEENPPARVTYYLSEYFETMSRIIHDRHGTLDKYVGDLIMAFWGAPSSDKFQAQHACKTAIDMLKQLKVLNLKWQQEDFASITIRIGINTGNAIVGNVGSTERLNYTALGDSVNLASRLQEVNKIYHTNVIVSEHTHQAVKSLFRFKLLDRIAVRGKQQAVCIYELEPEMSDEDLKNYNAKFEKAFDVYQKAHWDEAIYLFQQLMLHYPDDKVAPLFVARCQDLKEKNPTTWDGVWRLYE